eukprot:CAMPEP_0203775898 /NCGR_PEP_ID=MMETSP0099_2-20121227/6401_1 /ASSEMBLY_ACC=CAM_ASM_000209 /TAXON_ID=96639 /ORGANISM=" , Strain NY0313808BC1" /LENGTH=139 /DNA_ID=CAMNT_0050674755 /DNA_START=305 /DNA_END=720 /DNA_ORIENTATION=-
MGTAELCWLPSRFQASLMLTPSAATMRLAIIRRALCGFFTPWLKAADIPAMTFASVKSRPGRDSTSSVYTSYPTTVPSAQYGPTSCRFGTSFHFTSRPPTVPFAQVGGPCGEIGASHERAFRFIPRGTLYTPHAFTSSA